MANISVLSSRLDTLLKKIHAKLTIKLDVSAQAADSALLEGKTAAEVRADVISNDLAPINGRPGEFPIFNEEGVAMSLRPISLMRSIRMADDDTAIANLKAAEVSFADVFNKWYRISHDSTLVSPANSSELTGWAYDEVTDVISSTINSNSYIGLISNDRFETYTFETIMKSTAADDDAIGMVLAYKKIGSVEHTFSVIVDGGGVVPGQPGVPNNSVPKVTVMYNYPRSSGQVIVQSELGISQQTWKDGADLSAGVKVTAKRKIDNTFEVTVTKADGSPWPVPFYWTGSIPAIFQNACAIGYSALSQAGATWENIQVPTSKDDIIDTRDLTVWRWSNDQWVNAGKVTEDGVIQRGIFYKDTVGYGAYFLDLDGDFVTLGKPGIM